MFPHSLLSNPRTQPHSPDISTLSLSSWLSVSERFYNEIPYASSLPLLCLHAHRGQQAPWRTVGQETQTAVRVLNQGPLVLSSFCHPAMSDVLTTALLKIQVFWEVTPRRLLDTDVSENPIYLIFVALDCFILEIKIT